MTGEPINARRKTVGLWDVPRVILAPGGLFAKVEDVGAYGWALVWLLTLVTLIGYATIETGLIDRQVDRQVQQQLERIELAQFDVVERSQRKKLIEQEIEKGEFTRLMRRVQVVVAQPVMILAGILLIASVFYGIVALTGKKPEWHTLVTICVYAGYIDCLRLLFRFILMWRYGTLEVDTSLAVALRPFQTAGSEGESLDIASKLLTAIEPFAVWYWLVVMVGLSVTRQLRGWRAWLVCTLMLLTGVGARAAMAFSPSS